MQGGGGSTRQEPGQVLSDMQGDPGPQLRSLAAKLVRRVLEQGSWQPLASGACLQAVTVPYHYEVFGISTN